MALPQPAQSLTRDLSGSETSEATRPKKKIKSKSKSKSKPKFRSTSNEIVLRAKKIVLGEVMVNQIDIQPNGKSKIVGFTRCINKAAEDLNADLAGLQFNKLISSVSRF
jgi:hypothetical protein